MSGTLLPILRAIGPDRRRFASTTEIAKVAAVTPAKAKQLLSVMVARDLVESPKPGQWRSTKNGAAVLAEADRASDQPGLSGAEGLRGRLWAAVRKLKKGNVADIVTLAATGDEKRPEHNARLYLQALADSGFLTRMRRRGPHGEFTYLVTRDTGPKAPIVSHRRGTVTDPNTGEVHALASAEAAHD